MPAPFAELLSMRAAALLLRAKGDAVHEPVEPVDDAEENVAGFVILFLEIVLYHAVQNFFPVRHSAWSKYHSACGRQDSDYLRTGC